MPKPTSWDDATRTIDCLESLILESGVQIPFDKDRWRSLKKQLAATPATDLAGVATKLRIAHHEMQIDADRLDSNILKSAITELKLVSKKTRVNDR